MSRAAAIRVGTSGWIYKHWQGVFYPEKLPSSRWFEHYAKTFDTVEINNSFYREPTRDALEQWRDQAPAGFIYAFKAHRYLTHWKRLIDPRKPLGRVIKTARVLGRHLGPILYQLPPNWKKNLDRLEAFCKLVPRDLMHVVEFRDRDWLADETFKLLKSHRVGLCIHDMLADHPRVVTGPVVYIRFHGGEYKHPYGRKILRPWAKWIHSRDCAGKKVFVYFNNDAHGYAVRDALTLRELL